MNDILKKRCILGAIFVIIFGTLLHFVYEWSGENEVIGIIGAVNESTWEHLKLLFWPAFLYAIPEYLLTGKTYDNYFVAKAISFYTGVFLIVSLFYTYTGILGTNYLWMDITVFVISVLLSHYICYLILSSDIAKGAFINSVALLAIFILALAFIIFTFNPPQIPLFKDPISGTYGIS
ncbi:hypothetical protein I5677_13220 [Mobilitalea sibirica]|uniref:Uncharacterized protein n=1 Tax=Mobilitalea sibirica TaxID=1462919 RepID=A0A8J7HDA7_9FIRM|nr:DUF6512 family protein [Mobilitalea sibirica]MBH1941857.1 hypothetical protein [Mobilitalea sibirica]